MSGLEFKVSLEDHVSDGAKKAAAALKSMETELRGARDKLIALQNEQLNYKRAGFKEGAASVGLDIAKERQRMATMRAGVADLRSSLKELKSHQDKPLHRQSWFHEIYDSEVLRRSFRSIGAGVREMSAGVRNLDAKEMVGGFSESVAGLAEYLDILYPGLGTVTGAVVKFAGAMAEGAIDLAEFAAEVVNTNQQLVATFDALGKGPAAGKETLSMLNEMSTVLPQSREQLADWTKHLQAMGVTDLSELKGQLTAFASAQVLMGDSGVAAYDKLTGKVRLAVETHKGLKLGEKPLERLYSAGLNVTDIAARMGVSVKQLKVQLESGTANAQSFGDAMEASLLDKGNKPLQVMMHSLGALKKKGLETFAHLFDDIDTKPLTDAIESLIDLADQSEPSGERMKTGITRGVNGIIKGIAHLVLEGEKMFLRLEIAEANIEQPLRRVVAMLERVGILTKDVKLPGTEAGWEPAFKKVEGAELGKSFWQRQKDFFTGAALRDQKLPGHASGGIVRGISHGMAIVGPAHGEGLASIGVGERIVPAHERRQVGGFSLANITSAMAAANTNAMAGNSSSVHVESVVIQTPHGVTDAHAVTVTGLSIALERLQLAGGR